MATDDAESTVSGEGSPGATADDGRAFPVSLDDAAVDDKLAAFKLGRHVTASGTKSRSTWTASTVLIVGLVLIGAATVGAVIRDAVYLEMLESKAQSKVEELQQESLGRPP